MFRFLTLFAFALMCVPISTPAQSPEAPEAQERLANSRHDVPTAEVLMEVLLEHYGCELDPYSNIPYCLQTVSGKLLAFAKRGEAVEQYMGVAQVSINHFWEATSYYTETWTCSIPDRAFNNVGGLTLNWVCTRWGIQHSFSFILQGLGQEA